MSIGEDIGKRFPVAQGRSDTSGDYLIEDVELNGGQLFRRLVFLSNKNVVQSEARMTHGNWHLTFFLNEISIRLLCLSYVNTKLESHHLKVNTLLTKFYIL